MSYAIEVSHRARSDIRRETFLRAGLTTTDNALMWVESLKENIALLSEMPRLGTQALESDAFDFELRQLVHGRGRDQVRILYTVDDEARVVAVLHVRRSRRQPWDGSEFPN